MPTEIMPILSVAIPVILTNLFTWFLTGKLKKAQLDQIVQANKSSEFNRLSILTDQLQQEYSSARREITEMRRTHADDLRELRLSHSQRINGLDTEIKRIRDEQLSEATRYQIRITQLEAQVIELQNRLTELQPQLEAKNIYIANLENQIRELKLQMASQVLSIINPAQQAQSAAMTTTTTTVTTGGGETHPQIEKES